MTFKEWFSPMWTEITNHNRYKTIAIIACTILLLVCYSCSIKCNSVLHPGTKITREELQMEVDEFYAKANFEANSIARQEEIRAWLFNQALNVASTGTFSWLQMLTGFGALVGVGAVADNVRYRIKWPQQPKA